MNVMGIFKGQFISGAEFNGNTPTVAIAHVKAVQLEDEKGAVKSKPVVFFEGRPRGWVLCKTNALALAAMFTPETKTWEGKRVTLFATMVSVGAERKLAIRVMGSPDIEKDMTFDMKLPRKKAQKVKLLKTTPGSVPLPEPDLAPDPDPEPVVDPETGEVW